jgi:hypothetical protein
MNLFVVRREAGLAWIDGKSAFEQPAVSDHGPSWTPWRRTASWSVAGTEAGRIRVLLIASASTEDEVRQRLADDPWERAGRLHTLSVEPCTLLVGTDRLQMPTV